MCEGRRWPPVPAASRDFALLEQASRGAETLLARIAATLAAASSRPHVTWVSSDVRRRLAILADAAKYDASCASSGSKRKVQRGGLGNTEGMGICHSYTPDGRCVSLLKILLTNFCVYDCQYCVNRVSSDVERARFTPEEVVELTLEFYRRNYIEGLFLSSGVLKSPDYTMEQLGARRASVARDSTASAATSTSRRCRARAPSCSSSRVATPTA